jgi:hypothetical protein
MMMMLKVLSYATAPEEEAIILVPYGCTQARIAQFPVVGNR